MEQVATPGLCEAKGFSPAALSAITLISAAIISYEIWIMRVYSIGNWSHFGSLVVSIAMFGFGLFSTVLCIAKGHFQRHWAVWIHIAILALGPIFILVNSLAQCLPFNPIFLVSDPMQKYWLLGYFLLYFIPFLFGAMFIGLVFLQGQQNFGKVYFANMFGSGLGGLAMLLAMYAVLPERLYFIPLALWALGAMLWLFDQRRTQLWPALILSGCLGLAGAFAFDQITVSPYKGVSYARHFPDVREVYRAANPQGLMEIYQSSFFHFAPGLSDMAALTLKRMPANAYLGMYFDSDGPVGIMKALPDTETEYLNFLPMSMPYLLKSEPRVFVMQFGGGISTQLALRKGAREVTVAEGNSLVVQAIRHNPDLARFTGHILENRKLRLIPFDGRIAIRQTAGNFDLIDFSLSDSTGLSMPAGFSVTEKYQYTTEAFVSLMRALAKDGVLAVTIWNKEDPPKSTLRVMATAIAAARETGNQDISRNFFIAHTYLSTLTLLYKRDGFSPADLEALSKYCRQMSFEIVHSPDIVRPHPDRAAVYEAYRNVYFASNKPENNAVVNVTVGNLYAIVADSLIQGDVDSVEKEYVFNIRPLTNNRPYLSGFIKPGDLLHFFQQLDTISDEWGYLLLWAILFQAILLGIVLMILPMIFGWRSLFSRQPGKVGLIIYFICLGIGYVAIEIGLIGKYVLVLSNPTISATVMITGLLIFSGLGSLVSTRYVDRARPTVAIACGVIVLGVLFHALFADRIFTLLAGQPYPLRIFISLLMLMPMAFFMGFPFALGMSALSRSGREHFFVWAWGINGSFSVAGGVLAPVLSVLLGISASLLISAALYLAAVPALYWMIGKSNVRTCEPEHV